MPKSMAESIPHKMFCPLLPPLLAGLPGRELSPGDRHKRMPWLFRNPIEDV